MTFFLYQRFNDHLSSGLCPFDDAKIKRKRYALGGCSVL